MMSYFIIPDKIARVSYFLPNKSDKYIRLKGTVLGNDHLSLLELHHKKISVRDN